MSATSGKTAKTLFISAGSWHLPHTAVAFEKRDALAGLWMSDRNKGRVPEDKFNWCWPVFGLTRLLRSTPLRGFWAERFFWNTLPVWKAWLRLQSFPDCNVIQARAGYGLEPFRRAGKNILKAVDCCNSHPIPQEGYWQRELDLFVPGMKPVLPHFIFRRMEKEISLADVLLCPSDFVRDTMIANGVPAEKCFLCPYGFDNRLFTPRSKIPENPRFIFVGIISLRKGVQYLLRAFAKLKKQTPAATLVLVGGISHEFKKEARNWEGLFEHIPFCPQSQLVTELRRSTAFVFPSCEEGFARAILEAMGCALPVIATHESGATTIIRDGEDGLIVRPQDVEGLVKAMQRVANPEFNQKLGRAGYETVKERTWQRYGDEVLEHYRMRLAQNFK
jgi:glycosyltransferase involved in cell wall biosynthesis